MASDPETTVGHLDEYHGSWTVWGSNPIIQAWLRNSIAYYNHILEPYSWESSLVFQGEQGELVKLLMPQARTMLRQLVTLISKNKLSFRGIAQASGSEVMNTIRLANSLSEQIVDNQDLDIKSEHLVELALVYGISFIKSTWRTDKGEIFTADTKKNTLQYKGDVDISIHDVWNVFFDYSIETWSDQQWCEVRTIKNRWDLIKQFPKLETPLRQLASVRDWRGPHYTEFRSISEDDLIYVYEVYHKSTPALPNGRMLFYSDTDTIYYDGDNEYGELPVHELKPAPVFGMGFGSPQYSELLPAQEMFDNTVSAIATNQSAFGVQSITVPRGSGISSQEIGGMNFISFTPQNVQGGGRPEPLQLTKSPPEAFNFMEFLKSNMMELSNLNAAIRGSPPPGVTSGTAIATLTTNALEFMSSTSKAYARAMEKTMESSVNAYRRFAKVPRMIFMAGKNDTIVPKEFVGSDLDPIKKIQMNLSNPLMQTIAGRSDLAEKLVKSGLIQNVQDYITVLEGGTLQKLYETEASENDLIDSENESLLEGQDVIVLSTDDHPAHIRKHAGLLNDASIRRDGTAIELILNHIMEHRNQAQQVDPMLQAMVRTGKLPEGGMQPQPPPTPGGGGGMPPPEEAPIEPGFTPTLDEMPASGAAEPTEDLLGRV
jgi:hypothetical protein